MIRINVWKAWGARSLGKSKDMKMKRSELLADLTRITRECLATAQSWKNLPANLLNQKPAPDKWSVLECLEHLNLYGDFYLVEIEGQMLKARTRPDATAFNSGLLGNYFAKMMQIKEGEVKNKMKTFRDKNPAGSDLDPMVVDRFIQQQKRMLTLLEQAGQHDLTRIKTGITISKWIRLRLGDTLRVVIYHNERHLVQAQNVLTQQAAPVLT